MEVYGEQKIMKIHEDSREFMKICGFQNRELFSERKYFRVFTFFSSSCVHKIQNFFELFWRAMKYLKFI